MLGFIEVFVFLGNAGLFLWQEYRFGSIILNSFIQHWRQTQD